MAAGDHRHVHAGHTHGAHAHAISADADRGKLTVALIGVVVNIAATWTLSKANRESLNVEGAFQHLLADLFAFILTAIAGVIIITTGFRQADGIASLIIAAIMLRAGCGLLVESGR